MGMIYLIIEAIFFFIEENYDLLDAFWLGIFTTWLLHLAFISLVYTMRFAVRGKKYIVHYWEASSQISPLATTQIEAYDDHDQQQLQQEQEPQNHRPRGKKINRVMVGVTKFLCALTSVYFGVWVLLMVIYEVVHKDGEVGWERDKVVSMLIGAMLNFLLFVLVIPVSCIYGTKHCCSGNKIDDTPSSPKENGIQLQEQGSHN